MHIPQPRLRSLANVLACATAILLAAAAPEGAVASEPDIIVRPGQGSCGNYRGGLRLVVSASPNLGGIEPAVLIPEDTTVHLHGFSEDLRVNGQCQVVSRTPVPFQWRLVYRNPSGQETDATSRLADAGSLVPTFMAAEPGVFFAVLTARQRSVTARIEVIRRRHGWVSIGPSGLAEGADDYSSVGRVNQIAFDPAHPSTVYAAAGRAGVFKSISGGRDWVAVSDHKGLAFASTSAVTVSQAGTVFVGLGDIRGNGPEDAEGDAGSLWRSEDGGATWVDSSGTGCTTSSARIQTKVNKFWVSPTDPQRVLAATRAGLWRSTDGARCWEVVPGLDTGEYTDLDVDPRFSVSAGILWAAKKGSRPAAGVAFVDHVWSASPSVGTFYSPSEDEVSWAVIARAPSNPLTVYFAIATQSGDGSRAYLIRNFPDEHGAPIREVANSSVCQDQCYYNLALAVHPLDERHVLFGAVRPSHSTNAGADFDGLADNRSAHDDFHALVFPPGNFNEVFAATDGGVYRLAFSGPSFSDPGASWEPRNAYLSNANAGTVANSPSHPEHVAIGMWDSGTLTRTGGRGWQLLRRGDGYFTSYDAGSDEVLYFNWNAGQGATTYSYPNRKYLGDPGGFAANPYVPGELWGWRVSPFDSTGAFVWKDANTIGFPPSFEREWKCADPAPAKDRWLSNVDFSSDGHYFSAGNDGTVHRFTLGRELRESCDGARGVEDVETVLRSAGANRVNVSVDPARSDVAYVVAPDSAGENRVVKVGRDGRPDGEGTWTATAIAASLPADVRLAQTDTAPAIAADPSLPGVVYVGSTRGVFAGVPDGTGTYSWRKELDVPDGYISMIHAQRSLSGYSGVVRLASFGRGVWERRISNPCAPAAVCVGQIRHLPCLACRTAATDEVLGLQSAMQASMGVPIPPSLVVKDGRPVYLLATPTKDGKPLPFFLAVAPLITNEPSGMAVVDLTFVPPRSGPSGIATDGLLLQWVDEHGRPLGKQATQPWVFAWKAKEANVLRVEAFEAGPSRLLTRKGVQVTVGDQPQSHETPFELAIAKGMKVQLAWGPEKGERGSREAQPVECFLNGRRAKDVAVALSPLLQDTVLSCRFEAEETKPGVQ